MILYKRWNITLYQYRRANGSVERVPLAELENLVQQDGFFRSSLSGLESYRMEFINFGNE